MSIRIAFSGGGFRATLFHLGVVRYLRESGRLKDQVEAICSVSGGSILAAHLVLNWDKYIGEAALFQAATDNLIRFVRRDVRRRVCRMWIFSWSLASVLWLAPPSLILHFGWEFQELAVLGSLLWFGAGIWVLRRVMRSWSLIEALERQYSRHLYRMLEEHSGHAGYARAKLADLGKVAGAPSLHILSTNLTTGKLCGFDLTGLKIYTPASPVSKERHTPANEPHRAYDEELLPQNQFSIGKAVAASSAFPVLFSPVCLDDRDFGGAHTFSHPQRLADGGIFENFGLEGIAAVFAGQKWPDDCTLVLSDGQAMFNPEDRRGFHLLSGRASRTIDVLMRRVSLWQLDQAARTSGVDSAATNGRDQAVGAAATNPGTATNSGAAVNLVATAEAAGSFKHISLATQVTGAAALNPRLQNRLSLTRTDLDGFSKAEIHLLVYQGYCAARATYEPDTQDGKPGNHVLPPPGAYTESWSPTDSLSERVRLRLSADPDRVLVRSRLWTGLGELLAPLNWVTVLLLLLGVVTSYPVLRHLMSWWMSRPVPLRSWPIEFVESTTGEHAIALQNDYPATADLLAGIEPSSKTCKSVLLRTIRCGEATRGHPIRACRVRVRCAQPAYELAGAVFLVLPSLSGGEAWQLLDHASSFTASREVYLPTTVPSASLVAVLKIKATGTLDFPHNLASLVTLEVESD